MSESQQIVYTRTLSKEGMDRSNSKDSGIDRDYSINLIKESDYRRDSSGSNDSSMSKKQASFDEIQDLYSALQDLVKTNVTTTPISMRNQNLLTSSPDELRSSPRGSPKIRLAESMKVNEPATLTIHTKEQKLTSASAPVSIKKDKNNLLRHKRGHSAGNVEVIKMKNSPLFNRKASNGSTNSEEEKCKKSGRSSSAAGERIKKDSSKLSRNTSNKSETKSNKRWKPKLFTRRRSKSSHNMADEEEQSTSAGDGAPTPPLPEKNRRLSEADVVKVNGRKSNQSKQNSCPTVRKKFSYDAGKSSEDTGKPSEESTHVNTVCSDSIKNINNLVAALDLDYGDTPPKSPAKSPQSELEKLSNWFEQAAAEAVLHQAKAAGDEQDESVRVKKSSVTSQGRRRSDCRLPVAVRRGSTVSRREERRHIRKSASKCKNEDSSDRLRVRSLGTLHARSTPNLHDYETSSDVSDIESPGHTSKSPVEGRKFKLDEPACRLPKTPLFYVPDHQQFTQNSLQIVNPRNFFDNDIFFTEDSHDKTEHLQSDKENQMSENLTPSVQSKQTTIEEEGQKSMFTLGNYIEFKIDTNNMKTDNNANICEATTVKSVNIRDMASSNIVQEKSLWKRFRSSPGEKEPKAIMT